MTKYIVREIQNAQSKREGTEIEAIDLSSAKRKATRGQFYEGTVLRIETENGTVLAVKENGKWRDA